MKQSFIIDGYNLLHAMGLLLSKPLGPHGLEKTRSRLLTTLAQAFASEAGLLTVVFDASTAPRRAEPEQFVQGIRVLFALGSPQADDLIESLIHQHPNPKHLVVVSDDHRLQRAARRRHAQDMSCSSFLDLLDRQRRSGTNPQLPSTAAEDAKLVDLSSAENEHWLAEFGYLQKELDRHDLPVKLVKLPPIRTNKQEK